MTSLFSPDGRADTDEKKRAVVDAVLAAWLAVPDLRLGQLLVNAMPAPNEHMRLFYAEDCDIALATFDFVAPRIPPAERLTDAQREEFKALFANLPE